MSYVRASAGARADTACRIGVDVIHTVETATPDSTIGAVLGIGVRLL